jgi:hypothetical protein
MNHPPDDLLLRALHEPAWASAELLEHIGGCQECQARQRAFATDEAFVGALLETLDQPVPEHSAREIIGARPRYLRRRAVLVAEITLFVAAAAAAMTIPASPLHRWLVRQALPTAAAPATADSAAAPGQSDGPAPVGIALQAPESLLVEFRQAQPDGTVEVHLVNGDQVTVRSRGGSVGYTVDEGRVLIDNRVPAEEYIVELPVSLRQARIVVGTRVLFRKDGDRSGPVLPFEEARYRIPLTDTTRREP